MTTYISDFIYAYETDPQYATLLSDPNRPRALVTNLANQGNITHIGDLKEGSAAWLAATDSTAERWREKARTSHIFGVNFQPETTTIDCVAFCAHRGLIGRQVIINIVKNSIGVRTVGPFIITDEKPYMAIFDDTECDGVIINFSSATAFEMEIGVISVGKTVTFPRNVYVGHTPSPYARNPSVEFMTSDNGQFLGQYRRSTALSNSFQNDNIPADYYRDVLYPYFHLIAESSPFFFAWRPQKYPEEVGYMWIPGGKINVSNQLANGMMSISFSMQGYSSDGQ